MDTDIETKLRQGPEVAVSFPDLEGMLPVKTQLVHLTQYHEDGTQSDYYGIELWEDHFKLLKKAIVRNLEDASGSYTSSLSTIPKE